MMHRIGAGVMTAALLFATIGTTAHATGGGDSCLARWSSPMGGSSALVGGPTQFAEFDDGSGSALYVAGSLRNAGGMEVPGLARWEGTRWARVDGEFDPMFAWVIMAGLAVFDDGSGPALYVSGSFNNVNGIPRTRGIARWDGNEWSSVGGGMLDSWISRLWVANDGSGPALYASGPFTQIGFVQANQIARWDGTAWSALGDGLSGGYASTIVAFDDGNGPALYVSGGFTHAGGQEVNRIARWDGTQWSSMDDGADGEVRLTVFDDGNGPALYAGGWFTEIGGIEANRVARWDGNEWTSLSNGVSGGNVRALLSFDQGDGPALYIGGGFTEADGIEVERGIARWDGKQWIPLNGGFVPVGGPPETISTMIAFEGGEEPQLVIGQEFASSGSYAYRWTGERWQKLGDAANKTVFLLGEYDSGSGNELYASSINGGWLGGGAVHSLGAWDGANWRSLTDDLSGSAIRMIDYNHDGTDGLLLAGLFRHIDGIEVNSIAFWDGSNWSSLDSGLLRVNDWAAQINDLQIFDDGSGPALYAGGWILGTAAGVETPAVARWDGENWSAVGDFLVPGFRVWGLEVFDDGSGPALYAGGIFHALPGQDPFHIVRWDGSEWSTVGEDLNGAVFDLVVFDDGTGPALYAGGEFTATADGGQSLSHIARWDGTQWSPVAGGVNGTIRAMMVFEDCSGPALHVVGKFTSAGNVTANGIARWKGNSWVAHGCGIEGSMPNPPYYDWEPGVYSITSHTDADGPAIYVGGNFNFAGGQPAGKIARWQGQLRFGDLDYDCIVNANDLHLLLSAWGACPENGPCPADLNSDGVVNALDLLILLANWG